MLSKGGYGRGWQKIGLWCWQNRDPGVSETEHQCYKGSRTSSWQSYDFWHNFPNVQVRSTHDRSAGSTHYTPAVPTSVIDTLELDAALVLQPPLLPHPEWSLGHRSPARPKWATESSYGEASFSRALNEHLFLGDYKLIQKATQVTPLNTVSRFLRPAERALNTCFMAIMVCAQKSKRITIMSESKIISKQLNTQNNCTKYTEELYKTHRRTVQKRSSRPR